MVGEDISRSLFGVDYVNQLWIDTRVLAMLWLNWFDGSCSIGSLMLMLVYEHSKQVMIQVQGGTFQVYMTQNWSRIISHIFCRVDSECGPRVKCCAHFTSSVSWQGYSRYRWSMLQWDIFKRLENKANA